MNKEAIIDTINENADGDEFSDSSELSLALSYADDLNDSEIDHAIIDRAGELTEISLFGAGTTDDTWRHNFPSIARGECPLEKLPDYVRDRAKELYYN